MRFHFSLSSVLRLRESFERAELLKLRICAAEVARMRAQIESLDAAIASAQQALFDQTAEGISGAELQWGAIRDSLRKEQLALLRAKLDELEVARKKQEQRHAEIRKQREILSNLRDHRYAAYQLEASRREQRQIDELFLIRGFAGHSSEPLSDEAEQ